MADTNRRFLVIDDSDTAHKLVMAGLELLGLKKSQVDSAENGQEGFEKALKSIDDKAPYNLIFCDVNMPVLNGLDFLAKLRNEKKTQSLPVLMITTESAKPVVIKAVLQGISGYMVKPFSPEDVRLKVTEIFQRQKNA